MVNDVDRVSVEPLIQILPCKLVVVIIDNMDRSQCVNLSDDFVSEQEYVVLNSYNIAVERNNHFESVAFNLQCFNFVAQSTTNYALGHVLSRWIDAVCDLSNGQMEGWVQSKFNKDYTLK